MCYTDKIMYKYINDSYNSISKHNTNYFLYTETTIKKVLKSHWLDTKICNHYTTLTFDDLKQESNIISKNEWLKKNNYYLYLLFLNIK